MDETKYQLLEQASPTLCADRLDYFFRGLEFLDLASSKDIRAVVDSLEVKDGRIVVNNPDTARWLGYAFIETDRASWSSFREVGLYQLTAEAIKISAKLGFIYESDIWGSDDMLWQKLCSVEHPGVGKYVDFITPAARFTWDDKQPVFRVTTKVRNIDPPVSGEKGVRFLSDFDVAFARYRQKYLAGKKGYWPMGVMNVFDKLA